MKKVLIGMSGGVDSSVSALLLKEKGYSVYGATLNLLGEEAKDAKKVCDELNIPFNVIDLKDKFKKCVIQYFINEYLNFKTPNPCIECNKHLKFGEMFEYARVNNIDYIATGHYAKIEYSEKYKRYVIKKADNLDKDQSYVLYTIDKDLLPHIIFPLGTFKSKEEIRKIAKLNNIPNYSKSDSQDICFIKDGDYKKYIEENNSLPNVSGDIIYEGNVVGKHTGIHKYTIGQRKGLGISNECPLYVIGFDKENNNLIVGKEEDLYIKEFKVKNYNLLLVDDIDKPIKVNVKTRYKQQEKPAIITKENDLIKVEFETPQKMVTPGQSAVFYIDDIVLGGGVIV